MRKPVNRFRKAFFILVMTAAVLLSGFTAMAAEKNFAYP